MKKLIRDNRPLKMRKIGIVEKELAIIHYAEYQIQEIIDDNTMRIPNFFSIFGLYDIHIPDQETRTKQDLIYFGREKIYFPKGKKYLVFIRYYE